MVAEPLVASVAWVIGFITALGWPLLVLLAVSAVSAGTVIGRRWVHQVAREKRVVGRWARLIVKVRTIRRRQRQFAYLGHFLNSLSESVTKRIKKLWPKMD